MSKIQTIDVECPNCGVQGEFVYHHSITLGGHHKKIDDFEHGIHGLIQDLLTYRCDNCDKVSWAPHDLLINDLDNSRMIQLSVDGNDEAIEQSIVDYRRMFGQSAEFIVVHDPSELPPLFEGDYTV